MFTKLTGTNKAAIFTVLVLLMALAVALYVRALDITSEYVAAWYMFTPALVVLIMLLIVTRDGYSKEGWKTLGLHRLGLKAWWIAVLAPVLVGVLATAIVWATPLATIGVTRLRYTFWGETSGNTSSELEDEQAAITSHAKDVYEIADELALLEESFKQQLATPVSLGDKPLIVLTAGPLQLADTSPSEEQIQQLHEAHTRTQAA